MFIGCCKLPFSNAEGLVFCFKETSYKRLTTQTALKDMACQRLQSRGTPKEAPSRGILRRHTQEAYLDDTDPGLLRSQASHLGKLVEALDADTTILVSAVLHKSSDSLPAHLCHPLIQLHILQHSLHSCRRELEKIGRSDYVQQSCKVPQKQAVGRKRQ